MPDTEVLLPVYHKTSNNIKKMFKRTKYCTFQCSFYKFLLFESSISVFNFLFCLFWSILFNFEEANATHCAVENYLPSISAAIGHFYPQIYVWNTITTLQFYPRWIVSNIYFHYYNSILYEKYSSYCYLIWCLSICELFSLLGLSLIGSTMNYTVHAFFFVCFLLSSMLYMGISCYLAKFRRKTPPGNLESRNLKLKFKCYVVNICCFLIASYFFRRHNAYCEPKVYSLFALFEYGVVFSNILFHSLALWDFYDKTLVFSLTSRGVEFSFNPPFKSVEYSVK